MYNFNKAIYKRNVTVVTIKIYIFKSRVKINSLAFSNREIIINFVLVKIIASQSL